MRYLKTKNISKWSVNDQALIAYPKDVGQGNRVVMNATGALQIPKGSSSQRPNPLTGIRQNTDANGMIRYNTSSNAVEAYISGSWVSIGLAAGATVSKQTLGPGNSIATDFGPFASPVAIPPSAPYDYPVIVLVENVYQISTTNYTLDFNYQGTGQTWIKFTSPVPTGKYITVFFGFG